MLNASFGAKKNLQLKERWGNLGDSFTIKNVLWRKVRKTRGKTKPKNERLF